MTRRGYTYQLFVLPTVPEKLKWDGLPIGLEGAVNSYNADQVQSSPDRVNTRPFQTPAFPRISRLYCNQPNTYTSPSPPSQAPSPRKSGHAITSWPIFPATSPSSRSTNGINPSPRSCMSCARSSRLGRSHACARRDAFRGMRLMKL